MSAFAFWSRIVEVALEFVEAVVERFFRRIDRPIDDEAEGTEHVAIDAASFDGIFSGVIDLVCAVADDSATRRS